MNKNEKKIYIADNKALETHNSDVWAEAIYWQDNKWLVLQNLKLTTAALLQPPSNILTFT